VAFLRSKVFVRARAGDPVKAIICQTAEMLKIRTKPLTIFLARGAANQTVIKPARLTNKIVLITGKTSEPLAKTNEVIEPWSSIFNQVLETVALTTMSKMDQAANRNDLLTRRSLIDRFWVNLVPIWSCGSRQ